MWAATFMCSGSSPKAGDQSQLPISSRRTLARGGGGKVSLQMVFSVQLAIVW